MLPSTFKAITSTTDALLLADPSITGDELNKIKAAIRDTLAGKADKPAEMRSRPLVKRRELMRLTGLSGVSIDRYCRLGFIRRIRLGGSSRASGFDPESVEAFLAGRTATANNNHAETKEAAQ